ncbi:hypothetical protein EJ05DRAFT_395639 [Pseudovirgaria hyperparasitica]|uniref:Uncharacterized protein n=1 Tax=Pseudovirgaria hyperparasitica TaxID=470096 RepID=A0A6A6W7S3_9PEZI|nr:uncharacterized protein EJ05DRAFT_395639 [Pseudovirgaria hyperparasitica]KAF2757627.1 hypothetical protein EJ05DRAFT_395639 [Pseudovirgaria hyperparasitica]
MMIMMLHYYYYASGEDRKAACVRAFITVFFFLLLLLLSLWVIDAHSGRNIRICIVIQREKREKKMNCWCNTGHLDKAVVVGVPYCIICVYVCTYACMHVSM